MLPYNTKGNEVNRRHNTEEHGERKRDPLISKLEKYSNVSTEMKCLSDMRAGAMDCILNERIIIAVHNHKEKKEWMARMEYIDSIDKMD